MKTIKTIKTIPTIRTIPTILLIALFLLWPQTKAWADFADSIGFGHRAPSMGGAFVALADDASAVYYNPAGLAQVRNSILAVGIEYAHPSLWIKQRSGRRDEYEAMDTRGAMIGLAANLGQVFGYQQMSLATVGLGAYLPFDIVYETYVVQPEDVEFLRYKDATQRYSVFVGMGINILPWIYAGGGLSLSAKVDAPADTYIGSTEANSGGDPIPVYIDGPRTMKLKSSPNLGIMCKLGTRVSMGISYRGELAIETMGENNVCFLCLKLSRYDHLVNFYSPPQVSAGLSLRIPGYFVLVSDMVWFRWSKFRDTQGNPPETKFHNTMVNRLGVEIIHFSPLILRAGYSYDPSPVPDQKGKSNFVDNDKHVMTAGISWSPGISRLTINSYVQYHYLLDRHTKKEVSDVEDYASGGRFLAVGFGAEYGF